MIEEENEETNLPEHEPEEMQPLAQQQQQEPIQEIGNDEINNLLNQAANAHTEALNPNLNVTMAPRP